MSADKSQTTTARGYGVEHQRARERWKQVISAYGGYPCSFCGTHLLPGEPFDLDHTDNRQGYRGPAHPACNRRAGGRKAQRQRRDQTSSASADELKPTATRRNW